MIIAYLIDYDIKTKNGVMQKILQQSSVWGQKGCTVYYISTKTLSIYNSELEVLEQLKPLSINLGRAGTAIELLYSSYFLENLLEKVEFDLIYMRYRFYMPFVSKILKKYKVVMEINSDDTLEYKLHSRLTHIYNTTTRDYLLRYIDGFVCVSEELKNRFAYLNKPVKVIANGIDMSGYTLRKLNNEVPTFVFIGTPNQSWHGLDKIIKMAEYFKEYNFNIIGTTGNNTKNLKYFGYLDEKDSIETIYKADIGIGTLSLYKKGLTEASPLKTRQYLACGLPIIYAYKDTDLDGNEKFTLKLDNSEDNLDYKRIEQFTNNVFLNTDISKQARYFAKSTLEYTFKEEERINFFQKVLNEK